MLCLGAGDLSFNDLAAIMSDVLGKQVRFQQVSRDAYKAQLIQYGANEIFAQGIADMQIAKDNGMDNVEARTTENTTPSSFHPWCEDIAETSDQELNTQDFTCAWLVPSRYVPFSAPFSLLHAVLACTKTRL